MSLSHHLNQKRHFYWNFDEIGFSQFIILIGENLQMGDTRILINTITNNTAELFGELLILSSEISAYNFVPYR